MAPTLQELGIDRLSVEDRIDLALAIWDSIATQPHSPLLTEAQRAELQRRLADHEANPDDVVPWEQIKAEALARFRRPLTAEQRAELKQRDAELGTKPEIALAWEQIRTSVERK